MSDDKSTAPAVFETVIRSEDEAFDLLRKALANELTDPNVQLVFDKWPTLTLRFAGDGYDSTITPQIAQALVDLQHAMNRSYARLARRAENANVLTKEERKSIEFKAKVDKGSSLVTVDLGDYAQTLASALAGKMTGTEIVITTLGLAITGGAVIAYKAFLAARSDDKKVDQATKQAVALSSQETQRFQIFADALAQRPALTASHQDFDEVRHEMLRSIGDAAEMNVQGVSLSQEQARVIAMTPRSKAEEVQLNGNYRISKIDWSKSEEVRISLYALGEVPREFIASMRTHNLTPENIEKLKACEWGRKPIYLSINATLLRGVVTTAVIVGAEWPKEPDATAASGQA